MMVIVCLITGVKFSIIGALDSYLTASDSVFSYTVDMIPVFPVIYC